MSLVSLAKIKGNNIGRAILESLDLIDYRFNKDLRNVVIKLNACYYWDNSTGQTTDPGFVADLIDIIRDKTQPDVDIALVESDASAMKCKYAFRLLGYEKVARAKNVRLVNLCEDKIDPFETTCEGKPFRCMVPQTISHADLKINLPKIKYTMDPIKITCALKNIFGCNPYQKKYQYHRDLGRSIVGLNKAMPFDLCLIDGNIVSGIKPRRMGLVMASQDPVAIDTAAARIAGVNPNSIPYLTLANKEGLGHMSFVQKGLPIKEFIAMYPRKTINKKVLGLAFKVVSRVGLGKRLGVG